MIKILVIDDDQRVRQLYRDVLEAEGCLVTEAGEWEEATTRLVENPGTDIVLLDIKMPGMTGDELYNAIRLYNPKIKIVVSSVYPMDEQHHLICRADDYFDKADGVYALLQKVRRVIAMSLTGVSDEVDLK